MAYVSLYRKYRPQTFAEILGQEHVSQTLSNAINEDRIAHAYLFTGPRGTGKTSTARILAKALNCEEGPTPSPCGKCNSCVSISDGSSLDVIEMDAASHSKVDETREVLAGVPLATSGGRRKVYVIDEVHMLSAGSFNALLKTLEEPPPHVVFVLATTEAHKVLPTIVSRTQRFDFRRVPAEVIEEHLSAVAKQEEIDIEQEALAVIARHAEGGVRDALSALDQLGSISGPITESDAEALLGGRHEDSFDQLFHAVAGGDVGTVLVTLHSLMSQGADARQLTIEALGHVRSLLLLRTAPDAQNLLDVSSEDLGKLQAQAESFTPETALRVLDLLSKALTDMRDTPNHRLLLEVALVRAAAPDTDPSASGLLGRIERLERRIGIGDGPVQAAPAAPMTGTPPKTQRSPQPAPKKVPDNVPVQAPSKPVPKQPAAQPAGKAGPKVPAASSAEVATPVDASGSPEWSAAASPASEETAPVGSPPAGAPVEGVPADVGFAPIRDAWNATLQEVGRKSKRIQGFLNPSRPVKLEDDTLFVEVQAEFHVDEMKREANTSVLADALHATLGVRPALDYVARGSGAPAGTEDVPAPAASSSPADGDEVVAIEETTPIEGTEHDAVELIKRDLGAEVVEES